MEPTVRGEVTQLLFAWRGGDHEALNRMVPLVYSELRRIAHRRLQAQPLEHSLQTTALIHEAYLRLAESTNLSFNDRAHFLAVCAQVFRRILVDFARSRAALKRGGGEYKLQVDDEMDVGVATPTDVVRLNDALEELASIDPRKAKVIEMRFFGGLSVEESAEALDVSRITVLRDWRMARAWLRSALSKRAAHG
jgi:RNA polymerase sigma-70 factor (ECF subfamily)